jgi:hypothetical protein
MTTLLQFIIAYLVLGVVLSTYVNFVLSEDSESFLKQHGELLDDEDIEEYKKAKALYDRLGKYKYFALCVLLSPILLTLILINSIIGVVREKWVK